MDASYRLNPCAIFRIAERGTGIITIPLTQRSFQIHDPEFMSRLWTLIQSPEKANPNHVIDAAFIQAQILVCTSPPMEAWEGDDLSYITHQATRFIDSGVQELSDEEVAAEILHFGESISEIPTRYFPEMVLHTTPLPEPNISAFQKINIDTCIRQRKSCREFFDTPVTIEDLSTILFYNFGYIHGQEWSEFEQAQCMTLGERRACPSATGLQACDAFIVVMNISNLTPGIYFYEATQHALHQITSEISQEQLSTLVVDQYWTKGIAFGIFITVDMRRVWIKDKKTRGYVSAYVELGHISQNIQLSCVPLKLQTWITGTFRDNLLCKTLNLPDEFIFPGFFVGIGHGSGAAIPKELRG